MTTFSIEPEPIIYQQDRLESKDRLEKNICHLLAGEFVLLKAHLFKKKGIGNGLFGTIGRVVGGEKGFTNLGHPVKVSYNVYDPETKQKVKRDIDFERNQIYHLPKNVWTEMMFYDGTLIKREKEEDIINDFDVQNLLEYDSMTRTWNGGELTKAGNRKNNKRRGPSLGFLANSSNPFLVKI